MADVGWRRYTPTPTKAQRDRVLGAGEQPGGNWLHDLTGNLIAGIPNSLLQVPMVAAPIANAATATYNYKNSKDPNASWMGEFNKSAYGEEGIKALDSYEQAEALKILSELSPKEQADPEVQKTVRATVRGSQPYHDLMMKHGQGITGRINEYSDMAQNEINSAFDLPPVNQQGTIGELEQIVGSSITPAGWYKLGFKGLEGAGKLARFGGHVVEGLLPGSNSKIGAAGNIIGQELFSQTMRGLSGAPSVFTGDELLAETGIVHPGIADAFNGPATSSNTAVTPPTVVPQRRVKTLKTKTVPMTMDQTAPMPQEDASASSPFSLSLVSSAQAGEMPQPVKRRRDGTIANPHADPEGGGSLGTWTTVVAAGGALALVAAALRGKMPAGQLGRVIEDVDSPNAAARMTPTPQDQLKDGTIGQGPNATPAQKAKNAKDIAQVAVDKTSPVRITARDAMTAANDPDLQIKMDKLNREQHVASRVEVANAARRSYVNGEVPLLNRRTIPTEQIRAMRDSLAPDEQELFQKAVVYGTRMDEFKRTAISLSDDINNSYVRLRSISNNMKRATVLREIRSKEATLRSMQDPLSPFEGNVSVRDVNAIIQQAQAHPKVRQLMDGMKKVVDDFNQAGVTGKMWSQDHVNNMRLHQPNFVPIATDPLAGASTWEKVKYGFSGRAEPEELGKSSVGPTQAMYSGKRGPVQHNPTIKQAATADLMDVLDSLDSHIFEFHRQQRNSRAAQTYTEIMHGTPEWGYTVRQAHDPVPSHEFQRRANVEGSHLAKVIADPHTYMYAADGHVHIMHAGDTEVARAMRNNPSSTMAIADQLRRGMESTYTGKLLAPWYSIKGAENELGVMRAKMDRDKYGPIGYLDQLMKGVFPNIAGMSRLFEVYPDPTFRIIQFANIHEQAITRSINYVSDLMGRNMSQQSTLIAGMGPEHARAIADTGIRTINDMRYRMAFFREHGIIDTPTTVVRNEGVFGQWEKIRRALDVLPTPVKLPFKIAYDAYMGLNDIVRTSAKYPIASNAYDKLYQKYNGNIPNDVMREYIHDMKYISGDMSRAVGSPALANLYSAAPYGLNANNSFLHMIEGPAEQRNLTMARVLGNMVLPKVFWTLGLGAWVGAEFYNEYWGNMPTWQRQSVVPTISPSYLLEIATSGYRPPTMKDVLMMHQVPEAIPIVETTMSMLQAAGLFDIGGPTGNQRLDLGGLKSHVTKPSENATWWDAMHAIGSLLSVNVPIVQGFDVLVNGKNNSLQSTGLTAESEGVRRVTDMIGTVFGGATEIAGNAIKASTDTWNRGSGAVEAIEKGVGHAYETAKQKLPETPLSPLFGGQRRHYTSSQFRERNKARFDAIKKVSALRSQQKRDNRTGGFDAYSTKDHDALNMMRELHSSAESGPMLRLRDQRTKLYHQLDNMDQNRGSIRPTDYTTASEKIKRDINAIDHQEEEIFNRLDVRLATRYRKLGVSDIESAIKYISGTIQP